MKEPKSHKVNKKKHKKEKHSKKHKKHRKRDRSSSPSSDSSSGSDGGRIKGSALSQLERERAAVQAARYLLATQPAVRKSFREVRWMSVCGGLACLQRFRHWIGIMLACHGSSNTAGLH
jgi:hypothetical protein